MKIFYFTNLFALLVFSSPMHAQIPEFELVEPPKDQSWGEIVRIEEDYQGFLWLACFDGLYRYDGFSTQHFRHDRKNDNAISSNRLECLYADEDSLLFIGTHGTGLDILHLPTGNFSHFRYSAVDDTSLSNDTVYAITKDREGYYWIGTSRGLNRFDLKTGKFQRFKNNPSDSKSISDDQVRIIYQDRRGTIWIGTKSPFFQDGGRYGTGGLNRYNAKTGTFTRYMHDPGDKSTLINKEVTAIYEDSHGTFWVGTSGDGLHTMDRDKGTFIRHTYDKRHPEKLSRPPVISSSSLGFYNDHITIINEDPDGNIIIGTPLSGINLYNPQTRKTIHYSQVESGVQKGFKGIVYSSKRTRMNEFFVATVSGFLYRLKTKQDHIRYELLEKYATAFHEGGDGSLWISSTGGLIRKQPDGLKKFYPIPGKDRFILYNMRQSDSNTLWMATFGGGLFSFNKSTEKFTRYIHDPSDTSTLGNDSIMSTAYAGNDQLWVGTRAGLDLLDIASGKFTHHLTRQSYLAGLTSLEHDVSGPYLDIGDIKKGENNNLWMLFLNGGIIRYHPDTKKFKPFEISNPWILFIDRSKTVWAGSPEGLHDLNKQTEEFDPYHDNLKSISRLHGVLDIAEDTQGIFWVQGQKGFVRLHVQKKEASFHPYVNNNATHGFAITSINKDGELFIGDSAGYYSLNTKTFLKNAPAPKVFLTHFMVGENDRVFASMADDFLPWEAQEEIKLGYEQNSFSFKISCVDFNNQGERNLLYSLEGYENKWSRPDAEGVATYLNIPPGKYVFRVKAMNKYGVWANDTVTIVVAKPWWNTPWAYTLFAAISIILIYGIFRFYKRQLLERQSEKNREIERAHAREIEKAYNELKQTQTQLIHSEKMASLGELTAGIAHEIQNPLNFINNFAEVSAELTDELDADIDAGNIASAKLLSGDLKQNMHKIVHHGKRADSIVKNMLHHSRLKPGDKEDTDLNAIVDEYLRLSYHGLRAKDKSFNAAMQAELSPEVGTVKVVQQDISRVLLNLFSNAFYSVAQKKKQLNGTYEPIVYVSTARDSNSVRIVVRDNGLGIPKNIVDKIYQPFFTTKPTGEGTGLGLSMSYDIITKVHGGTMRVNTVENEFAEFIITLPLTSDNLAEHSKNNIFR